MKMRKGKKIIVFLAMLAIFIPLVGVTVSTVLFDSTTEMVSLTRLPLLGRGGPDKDIFIGVDHDVHMGRAIVTVKVNDSLNS